MKRDSLLSKNNRRKKGSGNTNSFILNDDNSAFEEVDHNDASSPNFRKRGESGKLGEDCKSSKKRPSSAFDSSHKRLKSDIDIDMISNVAESMLKVKHRTNRSIFDNPSAALPPLMPVKHKKRQSLAVELNGIASQSFTYIQNQIKNANVPASTLYDNHQIDNSQIQNMGYFNSNMMYSNDM